MGRRPCCAKVGLNKGAWSAMEDKILTTYIHTHGEGKWRDLPARAGLKRCGKSCRLRWLNYLRPDIKRGNISKEEEDLIVKLHNLLGNRWSLIAGRLPGRTDNEIKNYWNTTLCKRVQQNRNQKDNMEKTYNASSKPIKLVDQHEVIRTKAARCTKVVIPKELNGGGLGNYDSSPSFSSHSGFLMDFDINDLLETDTMDPNLDQLFYVEENNNGSGSEEGFFSCLAQFEAKDEQGIMNEPMDFGTLYSLLE